MRLAPGLVRPSPGLVRNAEALMSDRRIAHLLDLLAQPAPDEGEIKRLMDSLWSALLRGDEYFPPDTSLPLDVLASLCRTVVDVV